MEWLGCTSKGYGVIGVGSDRVVGTHILMFELMGNFIPEGMCVCHRCDNRPCCNPYHLFLGTHQDNVADRVRKGRTRHGEAHADAKLSEDAVRIIRASNRPIRQLASEFGIAFSGISKIKRGETWKHLL